MPLDIQKIRDQFPVLNQQIRNKSLIYFDNAATTQNPIRVTKALEDYYNGYNSNIHRGAHYMADKATQAFEATRETVKKFINAKSSDEVVFTKGTTDGINLVASTYGKQNVKAGDEIIISTLEHHSNIVPWQMLCEQAGAILKVVPINSKGEFIFEEFEKLVTEKTKIVSVNYASNALGSINPIKAIINKAHSVNAKVLIDAAQGVSHLPIDVQALDVDFLAFSAHKIYGPTGVGALYGKYELLDSMPPYQGGGEMIKEVSFEKTTYNTPPFKFEAGTPNIADVIAFKEALDFVSELGLEEIAKHEQELTRYATEELSKIHQIRFVGEAKEKVSVVSFLLDNIHPYDTGMMLDSRGIAVRTGHHCTQPLMKFFDIEGTVRASFAVYNTKAEIDTLIEGVKKVISIMG